MESLWGQKRLSWLWYELHMPKDEHGAGRGQTREVSLHTFPHDCGGCSKTAGQSSETQENALTTASITTKSAARFKRISTTSVPSFPLVLMESLVEYMRHVS